MSIFLCAQEARGGVLLNKIEIEIKWEFSGKCIQWGEGKHLRHMLIFLQLFSSKI